MSIATPRRRARRYEVETSLLFRVHGAAEWRCGRVVDMSITGLSWRVTGPPPEPSTPVHFIVPLAAAAGVVGPIVCGVGRVARVKPPLPDRPVAGTFVAVAIEESAMLPIPASGHRSGPIRRARVVDAAAH